MAAASNNKEISRSGWSNGPTPVKKFTPDQLPLGQSVFYRGERYYIETPSPSWDVTPSVRISSVRVRADAPLPNDRQSFYVHADLLELAPSNANPYKRQPSQLSIQRKEHKQITGLTDIGDPVAEMLRGKDLPQVMEIAAEYLGCVIDELQQKYGHLNPGQQRMNCGNRMRAKWKKSQS